MPQQGTKQEKDNRLADYITVAERIERFYERWPDGRINTHIVEHDPERGFILMRAEVYRNADDGLPSGTGHAYELKTEGYVQRTSYIEVCETSCVGRALANLGLEVKRSNEQRPGSTPIPLRSSASPDERCEATARQPVSAEPSQPQGTIIPNQLEWLKDRLGANLDAASEERFGRPAKMLSLEEAGDWIKELGKSRPSPVPSNQGTGGFRFDGDATAKTMADLVTPKQITAIRAIANAAGLNAETICLEACKCRPEELSRAAASAVIDFLRSKAAEAR